MKLKTVICLTSVLTFSSPSLLLANFSDQKWIYHAPHGDKEFDKCGGDLGSPLVSLDKIQKSYHLKRLGKKDFVLSSSSKNQIKFSLRHKKVIGENWAAELSQAPKIVKKELCVPLDFADRALTPLLTGRKPEIWDEHLKYVAFAQVVLDPGHGGNDWGTTGVYKGEVFKEKDLTLEFSKEFEKALRDRGVSTALTRNKDDYVALTERYEINNRLNPKLFLSLHLNSNGIEPGFEIFTLSLFKKDRKALEEVGARVTQGKEKALLTFKSAAKQEVSIEWAAKFKEVMSRYIKPVKMGMRRESFFLLYAVESPGLLIELGHLDREEDLNFWLNKELRNTLWKSLAQMLSDQLNPIKK